jgi:hypothetical protein
VGGLCANEMIDHCEIKAHRNIINLVLVWNYGQEVLVLSEGCYVILAHKPTLTMHWNEHGGRMCHDFWD